MRALHGRTSGLCQPTYVLDIPGGHGKSAIGPNYLSADGAVIEDYCGKLHAYAATASGAEKNTAVSNS
jgi:lysine 2,3-aminomutase